jgi:hypothetical protein
MKILTMELGIHNVVKLDTDFVGGKYKFCPQYMMEILTSRVFVRYTPFFLVPVAATMVVVALL